MASETDRELAELIEACEELNKKIAKLSEACTTTIASAKQLQASRAIGYGGPVLEDSFRQEFIDLKKLCQQNLHTHFSAVAQTLLSSDMLGGVHPFLLNAKENYEEIYAKTGEVYAFSDGISIYAKVPMLPSVWNSRYSKAAVNDAGYNISKSVSYALLFAMRDIEDSLPKLCKKTINYLFISNDEKVSLTDNDNHDCKAVTDVLCLFTQGGDAAQTTDFFFSSAFLPSDRLAEGTYIAIVPEKENPLSVMEIVTPFEKHLKKV